MNSKLSEFLKKTAIFFGTGLIIGLFFFLIFGAASEYSLAVFLPSTLIGLILAALFFIFLPLGNNIEAAVERRKDNRAQNTLEEACAPFMQDGVFTIDGKRAFASVKIRMKFVIWHCRLFVYDDRFKFICAHGKHMEMIDVPFDEIAAVRARKFYFSIQKYQGEDIYLSLEDEKLRLLSVLKEKNLPFLCEKMFLTYKEQTEGTYLEFQYRYNDDKPKEEVQKTSLFLFGDDDEFFREIYAPHFDEMNRLTGNKNSFDFFDFYSQDAISKQQAHILREELLKHRPEEYADFAKWLEKASTEYNGFYIRRIH